MVHQFVLLCFFGVVFESVLCSPLDVHRIVLKTHRRTRDHHKGHVDHRLTRKPTPHDSEEDDWYPVTTRRPHHHYTSHKSHNEHKSINKHNRKPLNRSTAKPLSLADVVEFTTSYPEKLPVPIIESIYSSYQISNNSLDLYTPSDSIQHHNINFRGKMRQHREKEATTAKTPSKGYEVYEEIIGDIVPPPQPRLNLNIIPNIVPGARINTPLPIIVVKDEDNHIKENVTELPDAKNKTYGRRTKGRRNRGNIRFDEVKLNTQPITNSTKVTIRH